MSKEWQWLSFILFEIILGLEFWCLYWESHLLSCFRARDTQWLLFRADSRQKRGLRAAWLATKGFGGRNEADSRTD